jgi:hypothetical protein
MILVYLCAALNVADDCGERQFSRAFGTAYEKDGMLIIPVAIVAGGGGGAQHGPGAVTSLPAPVTRPGRTPRLTTPHRRTQGAQRQAGASAGWYCRQAPTS